MKMNDTKRLDALLRMFSSTGFHIPTRLGPDDYQWVATVWAPDGKLPTRAVLDAIIKSRKGE